MLNINKLIIRKALKTDAEEICAIQKHWAQTPGFLVPIASELHQEVFDKMIKEFNNSSNSIYLVATIENNVVGHASVEEGSLSAIKHIGRLSIAIHENHVANGIGSKLIESVLNWARTKSQLMKIELLVRATNHIAINLYKKYGFEQEGLIRNRIKISPDSYIDDLMMGLWL